MIGPDDVNFTSTQREDFFVSNQKTLREHTCDIIRHYLRKNNNDVLATARDLDIGKSTIYKMIQAGEISL